MSIKSFVITALSLFCLQHMNAQSGQNQEVTKKVIAYVTSWSSIMPDPFVMTHINYAFGGVGSDHKSVYADGLSRLQQIVRLKQRNPKLKVLLSVGGWGRGGFTPMAKDETYRKAFAKSCRDFCDKYGLDGIDIDWEFPGDNSSGETSPSNEKQNYTLLMRDLREALGDELLLTMASQADPGHYNFRDCIQYLDFVNVMTYDMASPPNHHSALYRGGTVGNGWLVATEGIQRHLNAGVPAEKLVMGLAFYGNGNADGSGSSNQVSLQEIEDGIANGKWTDNWDNVAKVPYVTNKSGKFVFGYDNERSLTIKCQYIIDRKLAGGMYWEYANDNRAGTERNTVYECLIGNPAGSTEIKIGETTLSYMGGNAYSAVMDLEQGKAYAATGDEQMTSDSWYYDPDFFSRNMDGTYTFLAVSGKYKVTVYLNDGYFRIIPVDDDGNPLHYSTTDGTGGVWAIGSAGMGKPSYVTHGSNWGAANNWSPTPDMFFAMSQVQSHVYQFTLTVGEQLNPKDVNFKFFHQPGYGNDSSNEFNTTKNCKITTASDIFMIDRTEDGNIKLRSGKNLKTGTTYVFTLDCSSPDNAVLSVTDAATLNIDGITRNTNKTVATYDLQGRRVENPRKGIYIRTGRKYISR